MNYEETREQVDIILERVKALDNAKKIQLRRAYNVSFDELRGFQQITIKNILKDTPWCYAGYMRDFIVDMCSIYVPKKETRLNIACMKYMMRALRQYSKKSVISLMKMRKQS